MATIKNLNESLMKRIEALENDELTQEEMELEIKKSMAITKVADTLVNCARMALDAQKMFNDWGTGQTVSIPLLDIDNRDIITENRNLRRRLAAKEPYE